ncbi:aminotransferase class IV [Campylobacter insulaenigrae]|uniref:aminotransferase class IV n=1 Tax=Campylobacter insulaenigrae TaxID=260714 RepID=UPI00356B66C1
MKMQEKEIVFLNGEFIKSNEAKISIFDRGFIFGDGIYEVVPIINFKMADKEEFFERLERSMKQIDLKITYSKEELENIIKELITQNSLKEGGVYIQITRGVASRNFALLKGLTPTVMAFVFECKVVDHELSKQGVSIVSTADLRWKRRDIKSISLLAQCLAKEEAIKAKAFEAFMVENTWVTEASSSSAFIIKDDTLITKPFSNEILPGIRRKNILNFAKDIRLKINQRAFSMKEVYEADEVFISAATFLILGVIKADSKIIKDGKVGFYTQQLRKKYVEKVINETL